MSSLYELVGDFKQVEDMAHDSDFSEQAILDTLEGIAGEIEDKADGYAKVIKTIEADVAALKMEEKRLADKRKVLEGRIIFIKLNLENAMRVTGKIKFKTLLFSFNIQKNGGKRTMKITGDVPNNYLVPQPPVADNEAIRELLGTQEVDWAHLEPQTDGLRIK